jgi:hypothetical protein
VGVFAGFLGGVVDGGVVAGGVVVFGGVVDGVVEFGGVVDEEEGRVDAVVVDDAFAVVVAVTEECASVVLVEECETEGR